MLKVLRERESLIEQLQNLRQKQERLRALTIELYKQMNGPILAFLELFRELRRQRIDYSMTLFLFAAYRNLDSESGLGEAPALARVDSKTAVL